MELNPQTGNVKRFDEIYPDFDPTLDSIGGWLILIVFGRAVSIILGIISIINLTSVSVLNSGIIIIGVTLLLISRIIIPALIIVFMITGKIQFRILFIVEVSLIFIVNFLINDRFDMIQNIVFGAIWIPYVFFSKRVKNTYIYPKLYKAYEDNYGYVKNNPAYPDYGSGLTINAPKQQNTNPEISAEPTSEGAYHINDIRIPDSGCVECPVCKTVQNDNRGCCFNCGARFIQ